MIESSKKIAVLLHLYWIDLWPEFKSYLKNIQEDYDLYITIIDQVGCGILYKNILLFNPDAIIIVVENRGMDIGSTFSIMKKILAENKSYDYYLKLHSKKSLEAGEHYGTYWRKELIEPLCGNVSVVNNWIKLLQIDGVGMIASHRWILPVLGKTPPEILTEEYLIGYLTKLGIERVNSYEYQFVGGTMFWVNGKIWEDLFKKLDIDQIYSKFHLGKVTDVEGPTHEHSMERLFGIIVKHAGMKIVGV